MLKEANASKSYRDEVDVLHVKVEKLERLEAECDRYKEKLSELDFYKKVVDSLREENDILSEARLSLEEQLESARERSDQVKKAQQDLLQCQRTITQLQEELKMERNNYTELMSDNARLQLEQKNTTERLNALEKLRDPMDNDSNSRLSSVLSEQLNDSVNGRLRKLELENHQLKSQLDANNCSAELQTEVDRLNRKIEVLQQQQLQGSTLCMDLQEQYDRLRKEKDDVEEELSRERSRMKELERNCNASQSKSNSELQGRIASISLERETLQRQITELSQKHDSVQAERTRLQQEIGTLKDKLLELEKNQIDSETRVHQLDRELQCVEKENAKLKKLLQHSDEEYEQNRARLMELEREKQRLENMVAKTEEASSRATEAEIERRLVAQQLEMESRKNSAMRDDLIAEKTRAQSLKNQLLSLAGAFQVDYCNAEVDQLDLKLIEQIKLKEQNLSQEVETFKEK